MVLETLTIRNIRNHTYSEFTFPQNGILLWGENGAGKTAVLESISLLCTTKSFVTSAEKTIVNRHAEACVVTGSVISEGGSKHMLEYNLPQGAGRKQVRLDNAPVGSSLELFGRFPIVSLSPQYRAITSGGPSERRGFMDFVVSQAHHSYLMDLVEFRKVLKQRNALLADAPRPAAQLRSLLEPWSERLAQLSVRIVRQRLEFIDAFIPVFQEAYRSIVPENEEPMLKYASSVECDFFGASACDDMIGALNRCIDQDIRRGSTTVGPHRDDMTMLLNGMDVRDRASQGQHKSLLVSLKLGEYYYLTRRLDEQPLLLFDDVFSELDNARLANIMELIGTLGQTFITSASDIVAEHFPETWRDTLKLHIHAGAVIPAGADA